MKPTTVKPTTARPDYCRSASCMKTAKEYVAAATELLRSLDFGAVERTISRIRMVRERGANIYVAGNGGSSAIASHWVNDLGKATKYPGCLSLRVMSLNDNVAWLSALANDEGYERVFSGQLENFARPDDLLVVISASGNSPNLIRAVELARSVGTFSVGLLGFDGGILMDQVDDCIWIPSRQGQYELVEDLSNMVCHIMTMCLSQTRQLPHSKTGLHSSEFLAR